MNPLIETVREAGVNIRGDIYLVAIDELIRADAMVSINESCDAQDAALARIEALLAAYEEVAEAIGKLDEDGFLMEDWDAICPALDRLVSLTAAQTGEETAL